MNQITTTTTTTTNTAAATAQSNALKILGFGAATATAEKEKPPEELLREEDGKLNLEVAEKMLKWHAEAIGRCAELNSTSEMYAAE